MAASFPGAVKNFSAIVNGVTKLVAALFNAPYDEITAIETALGANMSNVRFGAWVDKSASFAAQQAATDGFVVAYKSGNDTTDVYGYTDVNADPTTVRAHLYAYYPEASWAQTFTMPVKKNDYWKIVGNPTAVYWIPMGG